MRARVGSACDHLAHVGDRRLAQLVAIDRRHVVGVEVAPGDRHGPIVSVSDERADIDVVAREVGCGVEEVDQITAAQHRMNRWRDGHLLLGQISAGHRTALQRGKSRRCRVEITRVVRVGAPWHRAVWSTRGARQRRARPGCTDPRAEQSTATAQPR